MKKLRLLFQFYHKSVLILLLVTVIMTISCFSLLYTIGTVHYVTYTRKLFTDVIPEDSYCVSLDSFTAFGSDDYAAYLEEQQGFLLSLKENPLIDTLSYMYTGTLNYSKEEQQVVLVYNRDLWNRFSSGAQLTDGTACISANPLMEDSQHVSLYSGWDSQNVPLELSVTDHVPYPYYVPTFLTTGNRLSANEFISSGNFMIVEETEELLSQLKRMSFFSLCFNIFITFREGAPQAETEAMIQTLQNEFYVESFADILQNTDELIEHRLSKALPIPLFLLTVSSASFLSISVLLFHKRRKEYAVYYLCGCSRHQRLFLSLGALGIPAVLAALFNFLFLLFYPALSQGRTLRFDEILFDNTSILLVLLYLVSMLILCALLPLVQLRNRSEIDIFRRT